MLSVILICFITLFTAELADKSQLIIFSFSIKYGIKSVLSAFIVAAIINQSLFIFIGHNAGKFLSEDTAKIITAMCLLGFATKMFIDAFSKNSNPITNQENELKTKNKPFSLKIMFTIVFSIFIAELGDLTMFATISFATKYNWVYVLIGSSLGIIAANLIALIGADILAKYLKENVLSIIAGTIFGTYGSILLVQFLSNKTSLLIAVLSTLGLIIVFISTIKIRVTSNQRNAEKSLVR